MTLTNEIWYKQEDVLGVRLFGREVDRVCSVNDFDRASCPSLWFRVGRHCGRRGGSERVGEHRWHTKASQGEMPNASVSERLTLRLSDYLLMTPPKLQSRGCQNGGRRRLIILRANYLEEVIIH